MDLRSEDSHLLNNPRKTQDQVCLNEPEEGEQPIRIQNSLFIYLYIPNAKLKLYSMQLLQCKNIIFLI